MKITKRDRVRKDLWFSVLNYSSPNKYRWHGGRAVLAANETQDDLILPTLTADEFKIWKGEFAQAAQPFVTPEAGSLLLRWAEENQPTLVLPGRIRGRWNEQLKQRVVSRLQNWFETKQVPVPADLIETESGPQQPEALPTPRMLPQIEPLERLRKIVSQCVLGMSWRELSELRLPATALLRLEAALGNANPSPDVLRGDASEPNLGNTPSHRREMRS